MYWNAYKRTLTLDTDNIVLRIDNPMASDTSTETVFQYRMVLMKI